MMMIILIGECKHNLIRILNHSPYNSKNMEQLTIINYSLINLNLNQNKFTKNMELSTMNISIKKQVLQDLSCNHLKIKGQL